MMTALPFVDVVGAISRRFRVLVILRVIVFCGVAVSNPLLCKYNPIQAQMKLRHTKTMNHPRWRPA